MSHADFLSSMYDDDLDQAHLMILTLTRLEIATDDDLMFCLGMMLMRLEGKQGEL